MKINSRTLKYDKTHVFWKDMDENEYCYETNNIYWAVIRADNEIYIAQKDTIQEKYIVLLPDGTEYLSYIRKGRAAYIKDQETVCLSFQEEIRDHILDENGNIYFVAGSKIYFYRRKKKLLEIINEIPTEYYFQRIEELTNIYLCIVCVPENREKYGGRDCRVGMDRNSKRWKEYGLTY